MAFYGKREYWEERYKRAPETYEWYRSYPGFSFLLTPNYLGASDGINPAQPRRILEPWVQQNQESFVIDRSNTMSWTGKPTPSLSVPCQPMLYQTLPIEFPSRDKCRVLILGNGNSNLPQDMVADGWVGGIDCVDWSKIVTEHMKAQYNDNYISVPSENNDENSSTAATVQTGHSDEHTRLIEFHCDNILEGMPRFPSGTFDLIICKGTLDAILAQDFPAASSSLLQKHCHRLLKDVHGSLIIITHGNPESRLVYMENSNDEWWSHIGIYALPVMKESGASTLPRKQGRYHLEPQNCVEFTNKFHYAYICRKRSSRSMSGHHSDTTHMVSLEKLSIDSCKDENNAPTLVA